MFVLWYAYVALYLLACHAIIAYSVSLIIIGELGISTVYLFILVLFENVNFFLLNRLLGGGCDGFVGRNSGNVLDVSFLDRQPQHGSFQSSNRLLD